MAYGITLRVFGERACFSRPEMKTERVSYDCITPSAARGILDAIHWKPAMRWRVDRITVLNEIHFESCRRNELSGVIAPRSVQAARRTGAPIYQEIGESRQQRATLLLRDVDYLIDAHFEMTGKGSEEDTPEKHYNIFLRRARAGQCFHRPCLGCREFPAGFSLIEGEERPPSFYRGAENDLGWMLYDIDFERGMQPGFFRAAMKDGAIELPAWKEVFA